VGAADIGIGLIDGPVDLDHPDLATARITAVGHRRAACRCPEQHPCLHGTFVAGILAAGTRERAPGICPGCTILTRPIFSDCAATGFTTPAEAATAIHECIDMGARILNVSSAMVGSPRSRQPELVAALNRSAQRGVLVVVAAGNGATLAATALTSHPWVVPVAGYSLSGEPLRQSTIGMSIGRRGVGAPARAITSLAPGGTSTTLDGTSFAAPFVTGTAALLWSLFPDEPAAVIRQALLGPGRRTTVVPPMLDAERAYQTLREGRIDARRAV